jgi:xanthine dehydrogenase accessory factor
VLVRGSGDVGSAVAHELFRHALRVTLLDDPRPAHARRGMAFTDALFDNKATLAGVVGERGAPNAQLREMLAAGQVIPVLDCALEAALAACEFDVLVDARMRKRATAEDVRKLAPLTVGLGPNFVAGGNVHWVVETQWGDALGRVMRAGAAAPLAGEPKPIAGRARERYVYAPCAGTFRTRCAIGDRVDAGEIVARIDDRSLHAPIAGCLRGLTHDDVQVGAGAKVIEVDPRGDPQHVFGLGERPSRIARGLADALCECP